MSGNRTFRQSMSWLHGWAGLLLGWLLFAIFLTGTLTVFDKEISWWMQPELRDTGVDQPKAVRFAQHWLAREHGEAAVWSIDLPTERSPVLKVSTGEDRHAERLVLDPESGVRVAVRDSVGGNFFFRFHYSLHLPRTLGIWLVGLAAMAMLVALVSGIVIHRHLFRDFFAFRPAGSRRAWLDGHNASAVLLLPFHLMITYTGLVIFFLIYMPAALDALYGGDRMAMLREASPGAQAVAGGMDRGDRRSRGGASAREAPPAELLPLESFIALAEALFGPGMVASLRVRHPGRANARVEASPLLGSRIALTKGEAAVFDGVSGKLLQAPAETRPSALTQRVMAGLHFAQFGGYPMRWLYFLCSAVSCALIASGLVLFVIRQRLKVAEANAGQGFLRLVETLNVGTVAGLMLGCVALLWAARLLPADLAGRAGWEARLFFAVWALAFVHAWRRPPMAAWREQLWAAALLCMGLPLLGGFSAPSLDRTRLLLELSVFLCGAVLGWVAWRVGRADAADRLSRPLEGAVRC
ncbi:PepSY-associated TM helix domain-containing protein [Azotobacter chroococcum]|uniref:PepSY-associated TM helix domain-containing protein n=1 Tax=Azotobacter chroococcum NCIMB 8003 TaxID=1328314 RepID=A0A0C4WH87_9GAMM|nr:PepSY-associated TM helix domain-containing protein [Azotobacter chroococcum]AJE20743.1 PepSY-associated TM helix domain-containing protein [Azotobacter chroococcum NCIMB 8003]